MEHDPLAQFRRKPKDIILPSEPVSTEYSAFGTKNRNNRLRIRSAKAPVNSPGYNILLNVVYDGEKGTNFILVFSILMVMVQGRNLQQVVHAIENEMADYIQEYDPAQWPKPTDAAAAFIESIEVKIVDGGKMTTETQH